MRHRVKNYSGNMHVIILNDTVINSVEDIRLIVNESQKKVLCSSMLKDNVVSVVSSGERTSITLKEDTPLISSQDDLTIEVDTGEADNGNNIDISIMSANDIETYFNGKLK